MTSAVIVAHGQPSDPEPAAEALARLARAVAAQMPGWQIGSATLAEPDALADAAAGQMPGLIYPMFMAGGWFTRTAIPARLAAAGISGWQVQEPFGCDKGLHDLTVSIAREAGGAEVLLAAHGSSKSQAPSAIAAHVARRIAAELGFRAEAAFIDQTPRLDQAEGYGEGAVCLPYFAFAGEHVTGDIPAALAEAGFRGRILPPVGLDARVPALIANAIRRRDPVCGKACGWTSARSIGNIS